MRLKVDTVDLDITRQNWPEQLPFRPALIVPRKQDKRAWLSSCSPIEVNKPIEWCDTGHDEFIRIPLFPYLLNATGDLALAYMLQLGLYCAGQFPGKLADLWIVTGRPVELLFNQDNERAASMRYWVGFAVLPEKTNARI